MAQQSMTSSIPLVDVDVTRMSLQEAIHTFLPMVRSIAMSVIIKCPPNVELDDMVNVGVLGLIDAYERFSPAYGKPFRFYAELRVRGEILDHLREEDWIPRTARRRSDEIVRTRRRLENEQAVVTDSDVAKALGKSVEYVHKAVNKTAGTGMMSLEEVSGGGEEGEGSRDLMQVLAAPDADPDQCFAIQQRRAGLEEALRSLPDREQTIIQLYYFEEQPLREIGRVLGVTESRASQMHTRALERLKKRFQTGRAVLE